MTNILLQIPCWFQQWKNFKNRPTFGKVINEKCRWSFWFTLYIGGLHIHIHTYIIYLFESGSWPIEKQNIWVTVCIFFYFLSLLIINGQSGKYAYCRIKNARSVFTMVDCTMGYGTVPFDLLAEASLLIKYVLCRLYCRSSDVMLDANYQVDRRSRFVWHAISQDSNDDLDACRKKTSFCVQGVQHISSSPLQYFEQASWHTILVGSPGSY